MKVPEKYKNKIDQKDFDKMYDDILDNAYWAVRDFNDEDTVDQAARERAEFIAEEELARRFGI